MACRGAAPIFPEEAKDHIGESASVRGLVEQVSFSKKGNAFLNFGRRYPQQVFTGFVPVQHVNTVGGEKIVQLDSSRDGDGIASQGLQEADRKS